VPSRSCASPPLPPRRPAPQPSDLWSECSPPGVTAEIRSGPACAGSPHRSPLDHSGA
jgi:hypothetical protein